MSRFYGSMDGSAKTTATRRGTAASGIGAHIRGWNAGIRVSGSADGDKDVFRVYMTSGSNGLFVDQFIGYVEYSDNCLRWVAK